jgi:hypothetical protein
MSKIKFYNERMEHILPLRLFGEFSIIIKYLSESEALSSESDTYTVSFYNEYFDLPTLEFIAEQYPYYRINRTIDSQEMYTRIVKTLDILQMYDLLKVLCHYKYDCDNEFIKLYRVYDFYGVYKVPTHFPSWKLLVPEQRDILIKVIRDSRFEPRSYRCHYVNDDGSIWFMGKAPKIKGSAYYKIDTVGIVTGTIHPLNDNGSVIDLYDIPWSEVFNAYGNLLKHSGIVKFLEINNQSIISVRWLDDIAKCLEINKRSMYKLPLDAPVFEAISVKGSNKCNSIEHGAIIYNVEDFREKITRQRLIN